MKVRSLVKNLNHFFSHYVENSIFISFSFLDFHCKIEKDDLYVLIFILKIYFTDYPIKT